MTEEEENDYKELGKALEKYDMAAPGTPEEARLWREYCDLLDKLKEKLGND